MPNPKLMIEPSHWLEEGIQLEPSGGMPLFKFTQALQAHSDELLMRSKSNQLSEQEQAELESITELSQIFTYTNSLLAANSLWFQHPSASLSPSEPHPAVNTATLQNSSSYL